MFYIKTKYKLYSCENYLTERRLDGDIILDNVTHVPRKDVIIVANSIKKACDGAKVCYNDGVFKTYDFKIDDYSTLVKFIKKEIKTGYVEKAFLIIKVGEDLKAVAEWKGRGWKIL